MDADGPPGGFRVGSTARTGNPDESSPVGAGRPGGRPGGLTPGLRYLAEVYADGPKAHWLDNSLPVTITRRTVTAATRLRLLLAPGGGQAIRIRPLE